VVAVRYEAQIAPDLGLGGVLLRPLPGGLQLRIEGVAVVGGLDIAARAGIAVPVPGAADIVGRFQAHRREARTAQAMEKIEAGKPRAVHGDVDFLDRGAGCSRSTGVWHGAPPTACSWGGSSQRSRSTVSVATAF